VLIEFFNPLPRRSPDHALVAIAEAPDVESVSAFFLELSSAGNLKTTTLPAFNREEMSSLLQRLG